ncbi:A/G-specific adenine glycosylase [Ornithinimicrobium sp.]|uniref:A/G-specific adenine glycosylase n=1 Tax=Ornithinimicrobium sp. TaxID=1977084 RepID=UPI0039C99623
MSLGGTTSSDLHDEVVRWYDQHARQLPWRATDVSPWAVLVSEVMLQQTPVARVEPVWRDWMRRWPTPASLAAEPAGEAVRAWGRLGYPRRALRLHACAVQVQARHGGEVPAEEAQLRDLPGIGAYTAAAVASFAFGARTPVVDTNVRRVLARALSAQALPAPSLTRAETRLAGEVLPAEAALSVRWNVGVMELGALVCTARAPQCQRCPIRRRCAWVAQGQAPYRGPARRAQRWHGTDRQCRGRLLELVRQHDTWLPYDAFVAAWPDDDTQRERCLSALLQEGLLVRYADVPARDEQSPPPSGTLEDGDWYGFATR